jgi:GxxExxY protein
MNSTNPFAQEGYDLMGAAFEVHHEIGGGLAEEIYQECLSFEFDLRSIPFVPRDELMMFYKGKQLKKRYVPDFIVHGEIIAELKAVSALTSEHEGQLINYMRIARKHVGYLINFGPMGGVEWKRFVISDFTRTFHCVHEESSVYA